MPEPLRELVVDALKRSRRAQRTVTISQACGASSTLVVAQILRALQADGQVAALPGGFWKWIGPLEPRIPSPPPPRAAAATPDAAPLASSPIGERWQTFRALCRYYAECVRLEERSRLSVPADKAYAEYMPLLRGLDWAALSAGRPCRLMLDQRELVFVRRGLGLKRHPRWFVGGPIDHYSDIDRASGERWTSLQPIFVIPVVAEVEDRELRLHPTGPVEINHGWLQKRFGNVDHRNAFLAAVGLVDTAGASTLADDDGADEHDGDDELDSLPIADLRDAWRSLAVGYESWWREFGSLERLADAPPLDELRDNGIYNRALLIVGPALKYGRRLVDELYELADRRGDEELDRTALASLFPHQPPSSPPEPLPTESLPTATPQDSVETHRSAAVAGEYARLNDEQRLAVEHAMTDPLTVLTGPPGTGKSVVVAHAMLNLALARRSVLFASRNHQAIEAVEPRLNALVEPDMLVMRPARPFGAAIAQQEWQQALVALLAKPRALDAEQQLADLRAQLEATVAGRLRLERQAAERLDLRDALARVEVELAERLEALPAELQAQVWQHAAAMPSAQEVEQTVADVDRWLLRHRAPGLIGWLRRLGRGCLRLVGRDAARPLRDRALGQLRAIEAIKAAATSPVESSLAELHAALAEHLPFVHACSLADRSRTLRTRIEELPDHAAAATALTTSQEQVQTLTVDVLRALAAAAGSSVSPEERERFAELRAGLENHQGALSESKFRGAFGKALPELLRHFPLWAVSNLSAHRAAPLHPAVFDLLIIDEASQCDIASVVPLMFRARRVMAVGDPMQLRHVSQLPKAADLQLRARLGLIGSDTSLERFSIGANSFYDLASSSRTIAAPIGLRAHYRCHPEIAEFCNRAFYGGHLRVMTDRHRLRRVPGAADALRGCEWTDVRGPIEGASSGCHSPAMTEAVLQELEKLDQAGFDGTVGVVTPFRVQADRIRDQAMARLPRERVEQWRLLVHTVDGFQGDERDVVLFAVVGGPDMPQGSRGFLASTPNRCNVAVSRARSYLRVLGNRSWAASCGIPFVQALERACTDSAQRATSVRWDLVGPVWEPRLADALRAAGLEFVQQYPTCGFYLDFALFAGERRINVEVDGETYHRGAEGGRKADDLYRDFTLRAAGWEVLRLWVYELREDMKGCVERIQRSHEGRS